MPPRSASDVPRRDGLECVHAVAAPRAEGIPRAVADAAGLVLAPSGEVVLKKSSPNSDLFRLFFLLFTRLLSLLLRLLPRSASCRRLARASAMAAT